MLASTEALPSTPHVPRYSRFFFDRDAELPLDPATGLLRSAYSAQAMGGVALLDLVEERFSLVLGPPYWGKSTVLGQLVDSTSHQRKVLFTDLRGLEDRLEPPGWTEWTNEGGPRLWLVDSLDENSKAHATMLNLIKRLPQTRKSELNILVSCRENEIPPGFASDISAALGAKCRELLIAPPDRAEAERICGADKLEKVLSAIRTKDLREASGQPAVLKWLANLSPSELQQASKATLWRGIIHALLEPKPPALGERADLPSLEVRFRAASRIAFFLEFGDFPSIRAAGSDVLTVTPTIDELFPTTEDQASSLRIAAFHVLRTNLFRPLGDGFRIHHRHLREWLVAFELARMQPLQIEELIGNGSGHLDALRARIGEALSELRPPEETKVWLAGELNQFKESLKETVGDFLSRFLKATEKAPYGIDPTLVIQQLRAVDRKTLDEALTEAAAEWETLTNKQRVTLLQIAQELESRALAQYAQASLTTPSVPESLGEQAVEYLESIECLPTLTGLMTSLDPKQQPRFLARVLLAILRQGSASPLEVLRVGLKKQNGLVDIRAILEDAIAQKLTVDEAIHGLTEGNEAGGWPEVVMDRAVELLATSPIQELWPKAFAAEMRRAEKEGRYRDLERWLSVISRNAQLRRAIYVSEIVEAGVSDLPRVELSLVADDQVWLRELLPPIGQTSIVVGDLYRLATREQNRELIETLRSSYSMQLETIEARNSQLEETWRDQFEQARKSTPPKIELKNIVRKIIEADHKPEDLIHQLGFWVFGDWRPNNVTGKFEDLADELKHTVLRLSQRALRDADSSPIPTGSTISGHILSEASVAEAVIHNFGPRSLGPDVIRKWLPSLLRAIEKDSVIAECSSAFPNEAVDVFSWFIVRDTEEPGGHAFTARRAPPTLWPAGLERHVVDVVECEHFPSVGRADLLKAMLDVTPSSALKVARALTTTSQALDQVLCVAVISVLLALAPHEGLVLLRRDLETRSEQALLDQAPIFDSYRGRGVRLPDWTVAELADLGLLLFEWFPEETYREPPYGEAYFVTSEHQLVDARNAVVRLLREQASLEAGAVLETIATKSPTLRRALEQAEQERRAKELGAELALASGSPPPVRPEPTEGGAPFRYPEPRRVPLRQLLRILSSGEYRLARTSADLSRVLLEVLERINRELPEDIVLLYHKGEHVVEDVLQAYLARRLEDLMPGRIVDREAWHPFNKRADFLVRVNHGSETIGVPIELKWSDNAETASAARDQLGLKYLVPTNRDNGILVVAWMGRPLSETDLRAAVQQNAREFEATYPGKQISVAWLEALPPPASKKKTTKA